MASNQQLEKPKRSKSSYMLFCDEKRPAAMEANRAKNGGKLKMTELGKELSQMWSQVSDEEKAKFETMAAAEKEKHDEAMKAYVDSTKVEGLMKRPQSAYFQFINANRAKIQEEHKITSIGEVGKKAAELWKAMSAENKKPYEDQYQKDKAEYEAWKETDAGKEALAKLKAMKGGNKEDEGTSPQKVTKGASKRAASGDDGETLAKKVRKVATPSGRAKTAKASIPEAKLSEAIMSKCAAMGISGSGVSYQGLLEKILATEGLAHVDQERALEMLKEHGGLLNKVRPLLLASCAA